jgi:uncharacterized OsmC-like protein
MPAMWTLPEYLERKRDLVEAYREQLRGPAAAPTPLRATVSVAAGSGVRPARIRDHAVTTDSGAALGGYGLGPSAPELLLGALASCLAHSALVIAADMGLRFEQLEVEVSGELDYRGTLGVGDDALVQPSNLAYTLRFAGPVSDEAIGALQADLERLCPVLLALTRPLTVTGGAERLPPP